MSSVWAFSNTQTHLKEATAQTKFFPMAFKPESAFTISLCCIQTIYYMITYLYIRSHLEQKRQTVICMYFP